MTSKIEIVFQDGAEFRALIFDAHTEEKHVLGAEKTKFARERTTLASDHHRAKLDPFVCEVIVSDKPVDGSGDTTKLDRQADAWALLRHARDMHLPCIVTSDLGTFDELYFLEASATLSRKDGSWLRAQITFEPMPVFDTETVVDPGPAAPARARPRTDLGAQGTTDATELVSGLEQILEADGTSSAHVLGSLREFGRGLTSQ